ncbi:unnamed protein product [Didymodactylos carnosus]|uniref:Uncharacterized protein n=1 Tax=Didymodactylos carnosus TaxID=1234261 RepID=A0A814JNQ6_9BILA|nr:unnamed protein product [Didymodactylos carnosus]CAF3811909.1 unnamed protein product [Didymodactylos carnosus]
MSTINQRLKIFVKLKNDKKIDTETFKAAFDTVVDDDDSHKSGSQSISGATVTESVIRSSSDPFQELTKEMNKLTKSVSELSSKNTKASAPVFTAARIMFEKLNLKATSFLPAKSRSFELNNNNNYTMDFRTCYNKNDKYFAYNDVQIPQRSKQPEQIETDVIMFVQTDGCPFVFSSPHSSPRKLYSLDQ